MRSAPGATRLSAAGLVAAAALAAPLAAQHEHEHHPPAAQPATQTPAARPANAREEPARAAVRFGFRPVREGATSVKVGDEAELRIHVTDPATGQPVRGLLPMGWIDYRASTAATARESCRQKVGAFLDGTLHVKHGQMNIAQPVEDLNGHYLLALARSPQVVVIDPVKGFGRTKLYTTVLLPGAGADWASTADDRRVFVTVPGVGKVAVINTHSWRVDTLLDAGAKPTRAAMDGAGRLWVTDDSGAESAVRVFDAETLREHAVIRVGAGPHVMAFSADGALAFVAARGAGEVVVIDARALRPTAAVRTGDGPADMAWSTARNALFVANDGDGTVAVVDPAARAVTERIPFAPGIRFIRFAPTPVHGEGHAAHGPATDASRLAFVVNPAEGTLQIYDAVSRQVIRTLSGAPEPDQIGFSANFAYVRTAGTATVARIPLNNPTSGATGPHDYFPAGGREPGSVAARGLGDVVIAQPGMHDAVYVLNPAERMIYSYHYMEGMPIPHGGLTTYGFEPRAIRTVSRRMRELEPGVYAATVRLERAGDYDLIVRIPDPYALECHGFSIRPDPARLADRLRIVPGELRLRPGPNTVRFHLTDAQTGEALEQVEDVMVQFASTDGFARRVMARPAGGGTYEVSLDVPGTGVYYASFEVPSYGITLRDRSPLIFHAADGGR
ncbi:MAG: YncE family protein [Gemmatimonadetes bacterium]|nr:YncE family protein [Gemmatimonadota bacterium]